jgi:hypothetical protein
LCLPQLGAAWFDTVAKELGSGAYSTHAADSFFQQRRGDRPTTAAPDDRQWAARAVLADMEPKARLALQHTDQLFGIHTAGAAVVWRAYLKPSRADSHRNAAAA